MSDQNTIKAKANKIDYVNPANGENHTEYTVDWKSLKLGDAHHLKDMASESIEQAESLLILEKASKASQEQLNKLLETLFGPNKLKDIQENPEESFKVIFSSMSSRSALKRLFRDTMPDAYAEFEQELIDENVEKAFEDNGLNLADSLAAKVETGELKPYEMNHQLREMRIMSKVASEASGDKSAFSKFVGASKDKFAAILSNPATSIAMGGLTVAVAASPFGVVMGAMAISSSLLKVPAFKNGMTRLNDKIMNYLESKDIDTSKIKKIEDNATKGFGKTNDVVKSRWFRFGAIGATLGGIAIGLTVGDFGSVVDGAKNLANNITESVAGVDFGSGSEAFASLGEASDVARHSTEQTMNTIADAASNAADYVVNGASELAGNAVQAASDAKDYVVEGATNVANDVTQFTKEAIASAGQSISDGLHGTANSVADLTNFNVGTASSVAAVTEIDTSMLGAVSPDQAVKLANVAQDALTPDASIVDTVSNIAESDKVVFAAEYMIDKGETLSEICEMMIEQAGGDPSATNIYDMVSKVAEANGIQDPNLIFAGQELKIEIDMTEYGATGSVMEVDTGVYGASPPIIEGDVRLNTPNDQIDGP